MLYRVPLSKTEILTHVVIGTDLHAYYMITIAEGTPYTLIENDGKYWKIAVRS